ncbi:MAG TPA: efflux RND transporter permease subunit [Bdellovibrionales bacterium]|nr:efflux RND transporter permease subunit [Bdellovibrionales bacterium]
MNLAELSVKRPAFITSIILLILVLGYMSMKRLGVDLFPNVTFPIVAVSFPYPGAGPVEMETQVSKIVEEEISTLSGVKTVRSINKEGVATIIAEFSLETDVKYAEQQIKDRMTSIKRKLPEDVDEPVIRRMDPADQPITMVTLTANLKKAELFDLAEEVVKPRLAQVNQVGLVEVIGGREREIRVELDRSKLKAYEVSASQVAAKIAATGMNVPAGKVSEASSETVFRTLGEYKSLKDIEQTAVNFVGNDVSVTVGELGRVVDDLKEEKSKVYFNGEETLQLMVFRQSGANTIAVAEGVKKAVAQMNKDFATMGSKPQLAVVRDSSKFINANVADVKESIFIGIALTILVVFLFLGNARSTLITGLALPNSLLGAFILMAVAGFTINVMSLLALSLAVGLLIDDAIVVRENIFRHQEMGKSPERAALEGTKEVTLAVIATTLTVVAVFGPIGFLDGVVGQFFKQFGLTIVFAMLISLFDAMTVAPMLSAYLPAKTHDEKKGLFARMTHPVVSRFDRFQTWLENRYESLLKLTLRRPILTMVSALAIFIVSLGAMVMVPKTFLPAQDFGEFGVSLEMEPGTSFAKMDEVTRKVDQVIRANKEVKYAIATIGNRDGEPNVAEFYLELVNHKERSMNTLQFKDMLREQLKPFAFAKPIVKDVDHVGGGRPFNLSISGDNMVEVTKVAHAAFEKLKAHPGLLDVDISDKPGKPEFQVSLDPKRGDLFGISSAMVGRELRTQIEGDIPAVYRENGREYDIRVRLKEEQRNLKEGFATTFVPNMNNTLIRLSSVADPVETKGPANINRQDRGRYILIAADISPTGPGMGGVMNDIRTMFEKDVPLPPGVKYRFLGQAENMMELVTSMIIAAGLGILFIYLVLASLYESFVTPLTIMLVLPLAACGAFFALLVTGKSLDMFSMIGCIMLLGIATKNSILLVDKSNQLLQEGKDMATAIVEAGKNRLRPILMTSLALIAGMLPVAIGLNEASRQRTSMGVAVIGGLITSTLLALVVIPVAFSYIERFRAWILGGVRRGVGLDQAVPAKAVSKVVVRVEQAPVDPANDDSEGPTVRPAVH